MTEIDSLVVSALPKDGHAWRIDWFGNLAFPNRMIRRTQTSMLLHFSRVFDDLYNPAALLSASSTNTYYQRKSWVSIGSLGLFRVGDIWRNGRLEDRPDYQLENFNDLLIDKNTTTIVKAGLSPNGEHFLLPLEEHPWHRNNTHSYCLVVDLPDNKRLVIPCYELIRFYFGSSSNLLAQFFQPPLNRDALYKDLKFDKASKHLQITLASKFSGFSAADIARIALDPVAWRAAAHIGTSSLKASASGQSIYPQAIFPFEGTTNLEASGKWLSFGERANSTFVVFGLRSCSHAFPFKSMRYETVSQTKSNTGKANEPEDDQKSLSKRTRSAADSRIQNLTDQDASNQLSSKAKMIRSDLKFPDLSKKSIWRTKSLSNEGDRATAKSAELEGMAVGRPGSDRKIRPIDIVIACQTRKNGKVSIPEFLWSTVKILRSLKDVQVNLLTASEEDGWTIPISVTPNEDGEIDLMHCILENDGKPRLRRMAIFALKRERDCINVVLTESAPIQMKLYSTSRSDPMDTWDIVKHAVADFPCEHTSEFVNIIELIKLGLAEENAEVSDRFKNE